MKYGLKVATILGLLIIAACTRINSSQNAPVNPQGKWGIAAFANNTDIPQAGIRAMNITSGVLRSKGIRSLSVYPAKANCDKLIVCPDSALTVDNVLYWARHKQISYVMMGSVNEWDYKVGLDGEPSAAVSMQLYHVHSGKLVWSSVGSRVGTSRSGLALTAQYLIDEMLKALRIC